MPPGVTISPARTTRASAGDGGCPPPAGAGPGARAADCGRWRRGQRAVPAGVPLLRAPVPDACSATRSPAMGPRRGATRTALRALAKSTPLAPQPHGARAIEQLLRLIRELRERMSCWPLSPHGSPGRSPSDDPSGSAAPPRSEGKTSARVAPRGTRRHGRDARQPNRRRNLCFANRIRRGTGGRSADQRVHHATAAFEHALA